MNSCKNINEICFAIKLLSIHNGGFKIKILIAGILNHLTHIFVQHVCTCAMNV